MRSAARSERDRQNVNGHWTGQNDKNKDRSK